MVITCPECKARYKLKDELIPEKGKNVRCKKCKTAFRSFKDGTTRRLVQKPKPKPPKTVAEEAPIAHSTVMVDASALQEAMKRQFQTSSEAEAPTDTTPPKEPERQSATDFSFNNLQDSDEFASLNVSESPSAPEPPQPTPQAPAEAFQTQAHPVMGFDQVPPQQEQDDSDSDLNLDDVLSGDPTAQPSGAMPSSDPEPTTDDEDPFADINESDGFSFENEERSNEKDPLTNSGNFGFDVGEDSRQPEEPMQAASLFDSLDPEEKNPFAGPELDIPDEPSVAEESFSFEAEVEVPEPSEMAETVDAFDVTIDGTVYSKIDASTLERWIKEGRLLESDQVSPSGRAQYVNADAIPQLQSAFQKYFNTGEPSPSQTQKKEKKGFFAKLFGR